MSTETVNLDKFVPNYKRSCEVCGERPCVRGVVIVTDKVTNEPREQVVYSGTMCGPCTFGESAMRDPANWND